MKGFKTRFALASVSIWLIEEECTKGTVIIWGVDNLLSSEPPKDALRPIPNSRDCSKLLGAWTPFSAVFLLVTLHEGKLCSITQTPCTLSLQPYICCHFTNTFTHYLFCLLGGFYWKYVSSLWIRLLPNVYQTCLATLTAKMSRIWRCQNMVHIRKLIGTTDFNRLSERSYKQLCSTIFLTYSIRS